MVVDKFAAFQMPIAVLTVANVIAEDFVCFLPTDALN
jgi:hypothetical protein